MAQQTQEIKINGVAMVTLNASTTETSASFSRGRAKFISVVTDGNVYISFDTTATTADPSILLKANEELEVADCDFSSIHAITSSGTATVRCAYAY